MVFEDYGITECPCYTYDIDIDICVSVLSSGVCCTVLLFHWFKSSSIAPLRLNSTKTKIYKKQTSSQVKYSELNHLKHYEVYLLN